MVLNGNGGTICSWNWKAGTTSSGQLSGGTIKLLHICKYNSRFLYFKYTGNGSAGQL